MAANVETMFYVRKAPWHGLGVRLEDALCSSDALEKSGLNWTVTQRPIMTADYKPILGYKANVRQSDDKVLGVVTDRYKVVQNFEAFAFTDALLGEGVRYETAGSLQDGKKIWLLAKLPDRYIIEGEQIEPFLVFSSSHDGTGSIKVAMTPIRVVCQNTLNIALTSAKRVWSTVHVGDLATKMSEAHNTLLLAEKYMGQLGSEFSRLSKIKLSDNKVRAYIDLLLPMDEQTTDIHRSNVEKIREELNLRYFDAPDLRNVGRNAYRFINAVSDFATHAKPLRETANYRENVFAKTIEGNPLIDKAYGTCVFEAKTASAHKAGEWEDKIPDEYMLQVQHYMAVTGYKGCYIAVLIGGNTFKWRFIERDDELISMLVNLEADFWEHVTTNTPPPLDGSDAAKDFINAKFPTSKPNSAVELPDNAADLLKEYDEASEQVTIFTERKQQAENLLKQMLGDNETGTAEGRVVTWKSVSQERLDSKTLKAEHPTLYKKYANQTSYRRFSVKSDNGKEEAA